jgi:hypothetical protein
MASADLMFDFHDTKKIYAKFEHLEERVKYLEQSKLLSLISTKHNVSPDKKKT